MNEIIISYTENSISTMNLIELDSPLWLFKYVISFISVIFTENFHEFTESSIVDFHNCEKMYIQTTHWFVEPDFPGCHFNVITRFEHAPALPVGADSKHN